MPPNDRIATFFSDLESGLSRLQSTDAWRRYLDLQARFPRYSPFNVLAIQLQRPDATQVAGYRAWRALGRQVRRGEHAIQVIAPRTSKYVRVQGLDDEATLERVEGRFFGVASVFDISQTEGPPPPAADLVRLLAGDDHWALVAALERFAVRRGLQLERGGVPDGAFGAFYPRTSLIRVREDLPPAQAAKTLAHELAHALLHQEVEHRRADRELEAESVAYIVLRHHGIDAGAYSFGYISLWQESAGRDAATAVRVHAQRVQRAAMEILAGLEEAEEIPVIGYERFEAKQANEEVWACRRK